MRTTQGRVTFSVVGLGGRASAYLSALQEYYPEEYRVVAVADPDPTKQARAKKEYDLGDHQIFNTDLELMAKPRLSDVAYGEKGYDYAALLKLADERMYEDKKSKKKPGEEIR